MGEELDARNACRFPGTSRIEACGFMFKMWKVGHRRRSHPRGCTRPHSWFLTMGSRLRASVRTNWVTSIPLRKATVARFAEWKWESSPSRGLQDGLSLFIYRPGELPSKISRLDLASGRKTPMEQLMPGDPAGVETIGAHPAHPGWKNMRSRISGRSPAAI